MSLFEQWIQFKKNKGEFVGGTENEEETEVEKIAKKSLEKQWKNFNTNKEETAFKNSLAFSDNKEKVRLNNQRRLKNQKTEHIIVNENMLDPQQELLKKMIKEKNFGKVDLKKFEQLKKTYLNIANSISGHELTNEDGDSYFNEIRKAIKESQIYNFPNKSNPKNPEGDVLKNICDKLNRQDDGEGKTLSKCYSTIGTDFEKLKKVVAFIEKDGKIIYIKTHLEKKDFTTRAIPEYDSINIGLPFKAFSEKSAALLEKITEEASAKALEIINKE